MTEREPASAQTISFDRGTPRPWMEARRRLGEASTYWLTTVRPDGRPHVVPVLAVAVEGALHFVANENSRKARNLANDAHCVIAVGSDGLDLVLEAEAGKVSEDARLHMVADAYGSKYDWHVTVRDGAFHDTEGAPTAGPPPYEVYEVIPTTAFGFGTSEPFRSTRWSF